MIQSGRQDRTSAPWEDRGLQRHEEAVFCPGRSPAIRGDGPSLCLATREWVGWPAATGGDIAESRGRFLERLQGYDFSASLDTCAIFCGAWLTSQSVMSSARIAGYCGRQNPRAFHPIDTPPPPMLNFRFGKKLSAAERWPSG